VKSRFAAFALALLATVPATAQLALPGREDPRASERQDEDPQERAKRLELWQKEARDALNRHEAEGSAPPEGVSQAEFDRRRRDLDQLVQVIGTWLNESKMVENASKAAAAARAARDEWAGFKEDPPYSVLMIDELRNDRANANNRLSSHQAAASTNDHLLHAALDGTKAAEAALAACIKALEDTPADKADAARWRLEAERTRSRLLAVRIGQMENTRAALAEQITAAEAEVALLDRKIEIANAHARLGEEEFNHVETIARERGAALAREIANVSRRLNQALAAGIRARAEADALAAQPAAEPSQEQADLARLRLELAETRIQALQTMSDSLRSLSEFERDMPEAYRRRAVLMESSDPAERGTALAALQRHYDLMRSFDRVVRNEREAADVALAAIQGRIASFTADNPRFRLLDDQRIALNELLLTLQRVDHSSRPLRLFVLRWIREHKPDEDEPSPEAFPRVKALATGAWSKIRDIWNLEISSHEKRFEIDGLTHVSRTSITLGSMLRALLFFAVGFWIASHIANRVQKTLVHRARLDEAHARMMRNWTMIIVAVILAFSALSYFGIPLTVFAFLGGAIAIGVGFGMQTIFKNFISGIIVLIERHVRVGDVVDVDGIVGIVTEINTRSSIIRSPDDVETMVPNSIFLENRVTNRTLTHRRIRRSLRLGVAYGSDPKAVMEILTESADRHGLVCKTPAPFVVFEDFGDSALIFVLYYWLNLDAGTNMMIVASDLRLMIEKQLSAAGLGVPFPQNDTHLITEEPIRVQIT